MKPYKRRNFLTKKGFQTRFIMNFVFVTMAAGLGAGAVFNVIARRKLEQMMYSLHLTARSTGEVILPELLYTMLFMSVIVLFVTWIVVRQLFRGINGPLTRLRHDIADMADGDLAFDITLRRNDEFIDVAEDFNTMASKLRERFRLVSRAAKSVSETVADMEKGANAASTGDLAKRIAELKGAVGAFKV